jgi:hypothetical protein
VTEEQQPKPFGAPPLREPVEGERFKLGLRVTAPTKRRLNVAAVRSGRSLSQEAEMRLERTFERQDLLSEVLALHYGREVAALVMMVGRVASDTADISWRWPARNDKPDTWLQDPDVYDQVAKGIHALLEGLRPTGKPIGIEPHSGAAGVARANEMIEALSSTKRASPGYRDTALRVRELVRLGKHRKQRGGPL